MKHVLDLKINSFLLSARASDIYHLVRKAASQHFFPLDEAKKTKKILLPKLQNHRSLNITKLSLSRLSARNNSYEKIPLAADPSIKNSTQTYIDKLVCTHTRVAQNGPISESSGGELTPRRAY